MSSKNLSVLVGTSLKRVINPSEFRVSRIPLVLTRCCSTASSDLGILVEDFDRGRDISYLRDKLKEIVGSAKQFSEGFENRESLLDLLPKSQQELPAKSIKQGLQVAWLKLSDPVVREKYVNFMTNVRLGRILEDLDTFAVWTSFMHNNEGIQ